MFNNFEVVNYMKNLLINGKLMQKAYLYDSTRFFMTRENKQPFRKVRKPQ